MCKESSTAVKSFYLSITPLTSINLEKPTDTKLKQMAAVTVSVAEDQFLASSEREMALNEPAGKRRLQVGAGLKARPGGPMRVPEQLRLLHGPPTDARPPPATAVMDEPRWLHLQLSVTLQQLQPPPPCSVALMRTLIFGAI